MSKVPGYYTLEEAAEVLSLSHSMVARYVRSGRIKAIDLGTRILVEQGELLNFSRNPRGNPQFRAHKGQAKKK